jgi:hypothetical protein
LPSLPKEEILSVISRLAISLGRRDEEPNILLAHELVNTKNTASVKELVDNLTNKDPNIASDCVKTLYEIGAIGPNLIAPHVDEFIRLIFSRHNRLVWGAMMALATIAPVEPQKLFAARDRIKKAMKDGSVITIDNAVKTLALVAASRPDYEKELFPFLAQHLKRCRTKEVPQHAESILACVNQVNQPEFVSILVDRMAEMIPSQSMRIKKIIKKLA